jgi:hypothetical protein
MAKSFLIFKELATKKHRRKDTQMGDCILPEASVQIWKKIGRRGRGEEDRSEKNR